MPISNADQLFSLVKSLTKSEKRSFKLYAGRSQISSVTKYVQLFDVLDKMNKYDEQVIKKAMGKLSKSQLSNIKRNLYSQILASLRLVHINKELDIEIRQQIDYAKILYGKGLYMQSLKLLYRIKEIAKSANQDILHYEIIEFEKLIEEKHITRSRLIENKMEDLIKESELRNRILTNTCHLTNLKLKIHGLYIQVGHAKTRKDAFVVKDYFESNLSKINTENLTFFERVYLEQSYVWYYYILLDFEKCLHHALRWVQQFEQMADAKANDPDLYMRGIHYVLTSLYNLQQVEPFNKWLKKLTSFYSEYGDSFNLTSEIIYFLYSSASRMHLHFMERSYRNGMTIIPEIEEGIRKYDQYLDAHRILVFNYRAAWMCFGAGEYSQALDYLNPILEMKAGHLRVDLQCYARLLHLLCHLELGNYALLEYLEKSTARFLDKYEDKNRAQVEVLKFIREEIRAVKRGEKNRYKMLCKKMEELVKDPFERRAFIYLDVRTWACEKIR